MNESDLQMLSVAVQFLLTQETLSSTIERLREELARSKETFVWSTVDLDSIPCEVPAGIRSCWVFPLRKDVPSGCHYHPNSIQHMVVVNGHGWSNIGGTHARTIPFSSSEHPLADKWFVIDRCVPHEFMPEREDMTVVSFHTCDESELEEVACETGAARLYEDPVMVQPRGPE